MTILAEAQKRGAPVFEVSSCARADITARSPQGSRFLFEVNQWGRGEVSLPLLGDHQVENTLAAFLVLALWGLSFDLSRLQEALRSLRWPGRVDVLSLSPLLVFDVAHNQASFQVLREALSRYLGVDKAVYLLGFLGGKDCRGIAQELKSSSAYLVLTEPLHPKAMSAFEAFSFFSELSVPCEVVPDALQAKERALSLARNLGLPLVVAGSFYLARPFQEEFQVGEVLEEEVELC